MTDGYVNPTGRGEKKDPYGSLPVIQGPSFTSTRPQRAAANAKNAPAIGTSDRGHIMAETHPGFDPLSAVSTQTGGEPGVTDQSPSGSTPGVKHVEVAK
jgi:hypothetical protein